MNYEEIIMQLIIGNGSSRSFSMEAINYAKNGDIEVARNTLQSAADDSC